PRPCGFPAEGDRGIAHRSSAVNRRGFGHSRRELSSSGGDRPNLGVAIRDGRRLTDIQNLIFLRLASVKMKEDCYDTAKIERIAFSAL
ncbi:MAG: hypothetical protein ABSC72_08505, partial [Methylovirgula sp.]